MGEGQPDQEEYFLALEGCIDTAIACGAFLETHRKKSGDLKAKIDRTKYANVHNLILNAIQQDVLLCVAKIWDKTEGAHSLPRLIREDDWNNLEKRVAENIENRIEAKSKLEALMECYLASDQFRGLLVSRAEGFAHNVPVAREREKMKNPQPATLDDIYCGLDNAIEAVNLAKLALNNSSTHKGLLSEQFGKLSEEYFDLIPNLNIEIA